MSKVFALNLRNYRLLAHMTQGELAEAAGITRASVNNYELGRSEPPFEVLCKFAEVLGVELSNLVTEHEIVGENHRKWLLSDEEAAIIQAYREADPIYQGVALTILREHKKNG